MIEKNERAEEGSQEIMGNGYGRESPEKKLVGREWGWCWMEGIHGCLRVWREVEWEGRVGGGEFINAKGGWGDRWETGERQTRNGPQWVTYGKNVGQSLVALLPCQKLHTYVYISASTFEDMFHAFMFLPSSQYYHNWKKYSTSSGFWLYLGEYLDTSLYYNHPRSNLRCVFTQWPMCFQLLFHRISLFHPLWMVDGSGRSR